MIENRHLESPFRCISTYFWEYLNLVSEYYHPLSYKRTKSHSFSEHWHPKSKSIVLSFILFRSMYTHIICFHVFRSIGTHNSLNLFYFCAPFLLDYKLMHNYMAGKLLQMSKLKQVLQLHVTGASNRSIASKVGLTKRL